MDYGNNLILNPNSPELNGDQAESLPGNEGEADYDKDDLKNCILENFRNDIRDKEDMDWISIRSWDIESYYLIKDLTFQNWPWKNAYNQRQPLTPALVDTGVANVKGSLTSVADKIVSVKGVGVEDMRKAPILESLLNWQMLNEIDNLDKTLYMHIFRTFLHGTGVTKVTQNMEENSVGIISLDLENIFVPVSAKGFQVKDTDHVFQIVPLSFNDIEYRKRLDIYENLDRIPMGAGVNYTVAQEQLTRLRDQAAGTGMETKLRRDTYYIMECWKTYYPKVSSAGFNGKNGNVRSSAGARGKEIKVWIAPNGGEILRQKRNESGIRPYSDAHPYPHGDRFYSYSMPQKLRSVQEDLDYVVKQAFDSSDKRYMRAGFVDDTSGFNKGTQQRHPGGLYKKGKGSSPIEWEPDIPIDPTLERRIDWLWQQGEKLIGLFDVSQGASPTADRTLGQTEIRTFKADVRFKTVLDAFGSWFKKTMDLVYYYDDEFMPRDKKIRVLGYADYKTIEEIFPAENRTLGLGLKGKFDFWFAGAALSEIENDRQKTIEWCRESLADPRIIQNSADWWKVKKLQAEAYGIRDMETILTKPPEAQIMGAIEAVERIVSGQYDIQPRPGIDTESYLFEIELFSRSEGFRGLEPQGQQALTTLYRRVKIMDEMQRRAQMDLMMIQQSAFANALPPPVPGQPGANGNGKELALAGNGEIP